MKSFEFLLILAGVDHTDSAMADTLYDAGCDDGTLFSSGGVAGIGFTREAPTLEAAVRSAIADVARAGLSVSRVEPADAPIFARINRARDSLTEPQPGAERVFGLRRNF